MHSDKFKYKLFGRFKGRKKIDLKAVHGFNKYKLNISRDIKKKNYNILDIGSGSGENAIYLSRMYPKAKIITCELYEDGNINLCNKIINNKITNIRLFCGNVLEFLDQIKCIFIFDEIWILFPDPWPKTRHNKRRLINNCFMNKITAFHKNSGKLMLASDSQSYIQLFYKIIYDSRHLYTWQNQRVEEWNYDNLELCKTKFYEKAKKLNRKSMFFKLDKI